MLCSTICESYAKLLLVTSLFDQLDSLIVMASRDDSAFYSAFNKDMAGKYRHVEDWADSLRKKILWDHRVPEDNEKLVLDKKVKNADGDGVADQRQTAGFVGMINQQTLAFFYWPVELGS